ncbi:hypothetical protein [Kitasatospora sp. GP82]|uniref:hypothetical protein n=1 Tax=Kitasatospora sp. GP82 TaxID=3035089 RepID=UPI002475D9AF|nr:hypothetical protein [Kitasatospora sp. GP82]MDH6125954.1 hypothetical protein [Kitasatospora sp. GP82]
MPKPDPAKRAQTAAEAIRELNHITLDQRISAPVISTTTQALCRLVDGLPQTLDQLARQLKTRQKERAIQMDTGEDSEAAVAEVAKSLEDSVLYLGRLSNSLHAAASPLFHMGAK